MGKIRSFFCFSVIFCITPLIATFSTPKLTIIFVLDGVGYHVIQKLQPFFKGGLKELLDKGIVYQNAYHPHAQPTTAIGHTALATGAFADMHGIVANSWLKADGTKVDSIEDDNPYTIEFGATQKDTKGKSPHNIMVEGISDQIMLHSQPDHPYIVYAVSFKDRAAIPLAGKLGKAIWFNYYSGKFTSSKAYFETLPAWVMQLNTVLPITKKKWVPWKQVFSPTSQAYNFRFINDYRYASAQRLVGTRIPKRSISLTPKEYKLFTVSPIGQNMLFTCAQHCLDYLLQTYSNHSILLWISISTPDKIGHWFGPDSLEYIDLMYHVDQQLGSFMNYVKRKVAPNSTLFALTADHGSTPIVEFLQEEGINTAQRVNSVEMAQKVNHVIAKTFNLQKNCIFSIQPPQVYCNEPYLATLPLEMKNNILKKIKEELLGQSGIHQVWTRQERDAICQTLPSLAAYYKHQCYREREGLLAVQVQPYTYLASYQEGTGHRTPYEYDTHVPFILYQPNRFEKKQVDEKAWTLQLAPTLASLYNVPKPSGAFLDMLPCLNITD